MPAPSPDPLRLRRRLGLQGGSFVLLLLLVFSGAVYIGMALEERQGLRASVRELAATAATQLPLIAHEYGEEGNAYRIRWFDAEGRLLEDQGQLSLPTEAGARLAVPLQPRWREWRGGLSLELPVFTRERSRPGEPPRRSGTVPAALSDQRLHQQLAWLRRGLLLGVLSTAVVVLLVGRRMLDSAFLPLQRQVLALERFTADASHELRHPLTLLRPLVAAAQPAAPAGAPQDLLPRIDHIAARMGLLLGGPGGADAPGPARAAAAAVHQPAAQRHPPQPRGRLGAAGAPPAPGPGAGEPHRSGAGPSPGPTAAMWSWLMAVRERAVSGWNCRSPDRRGVSHDFLTTAGSGW